MSDHFAVCDNDQLSAGQIRTPPGVKLSQQETPMDDSQLQGVKETPRNRPGTQNLYGQS